jgi:hypothetical protein
MTTADEKLTEGEVARRRDDAIRRALHTPPTPTKEMVGKTERAQGRQAIKASRKAQAKTKDA